MSDWNPPPSFYREALRHCRCCNICEYGARPCDGVLAGGMCDEMCRCDNRHLEDSRFDEDYDDE